MLKYSKLAITGTIYLALTTGAFAYSYSISAPSVGSTGLSEQEQINILAAQLEAQAAANNFTSLDYVINPLAPSAAATWKTCTLTIEIKNTNPKQTKEVQVTTSSANVCNNLCTNYAVNGDKCTGSKWG